MYAVVNLIVKTFVSNKKLIKLQIVRDWKNVIL